MSAPDGGPETPIQSVGRGNTTHALRRRFDAGEVAAEAAARGEDPLQSVIGQAMGFASACWENLAGAGAFESDQARQALDSTLAWLQGREAGLVQGASSAVVMEPGDRLLLQARREWPDAETARAVVKAIKAAVYDQGKQVSVIEGFDVVIIRAGVRSPEEGEGGGVDVG